MRQKLFESPDFSEIRILAIIAFLSSLIRFFYDNVLFSLQLSFAQNFLVPLICVSLFLSQNDHLSLKERFIAGVKLSILLGGTAAAFFLLVGEINFYFLGGRGTAAEILGQSVYPLTFNLILVSLKTRAFIWFLLLLLSNSAGILAVLFSIGRKYVKQFGSE